MLHFITGSSKKFTEISALIPDLKQLDLDLPEIQEIDAKEIIRAKLKEATTHHDGVFIVEDTSFYLDCLGGQLPGPLIKWFLKGIGAAGVYDLAVKYDNFGATARTIIGYANGHDDIHFFAGERRGRVVPPRGDNGFGWDKIFVADGETKTQAEMTVEEKNRISQRALAVGQLAKFLAETDGR